MAGYFSTALLFLVLLFTFGLVWMMVSPIWFMFINAVTVTVRNYEWTNEAQTTFSNIKSYINNLFVWLGPVLFIFAIIWLLVRSYRKEELSYVQD